MTTLRSIIVDDEATSLRSLKYEIETYCNDVEVVSGLQDPVVAIDEIKKEKPDVVFLDIEMPVINGFELLQSFQKIDFDVIFVTAYDQFAVRAFEFNAIDYLLKPVLKSKLVQSVQKVREKKTHHFPQTDLNALVHNIQYQNGGSLIKSIAIPTSEGFEMIHIDEIVYLQAESNYTWVHLENRQKYLVSKTLKEVSGMVTGTQFFRAHKSYFVNLNYLRRYVRGRGGYLIMKDDTQIPVSRSNRNDLLKLLNLS